MLFDDVVGRFFFLMSPPIPSDTSSPNPVYYPSSFSHSLPHLFLFFLLLSDSDVVRRRRHIDDSSQQHHHQPQQNSPLPSPIFRKIGGEGENTMNLHNTLTSPLFSTTSSTTSPPKPNLISISHSEDHDEAEGGDVDGNYPHHGRDPQPIHLPLWEGTHLSLSHLLLLLLLLTVSS